MAAGVSVTVQAQVPSGAAGVLGQRFIEGRLGFFRPTEESTFDRGTAGGFLVNVPATTAVDVTLGGSSSKITGTSIGGMLAPPTDYARRERAASVAGTFYLRRGSLSPFLRLNATYLRLTDENSWGTSATLPGGHVELNKSGLGFGAGFGMEIVLPGFALTPAVEYADHGVGTNFLDTRRTWHYGFTVHGWLTKSLGGFVATGYAHSTRHDSYRVWSSEAGARVRF